MAIVKILHLFKFQLTWMHLILRFVILCLNVAQVLGDCPWEALIGQPHVLLPDGQGTIQTFAGQLKVIHGHLKHRCVRCYTLNS